MKCYHACEIVILYYKEFWKLAQLEADKTEIKRLS